MSKKTITLDAAGQPGGPSAKEQARVDAEQLEIIAAQRAAREPFERAEHLARQAKLTRGAEAADENKRLKATVADLVKRVEDLEAKNG